MASNKEKKKLSRGAKYLVTASVIAAVYAVLTVALEPISYGVIQFRVSEALTILPFFTPAAVPGLAVGCLIANIFGGMGLLDILIGTLSTLLAAYLTSIIRCKWLSPLPPVIINALGVGIVLTVYTGLPYWQCAAYVAAGQAVCCYALGLPLLLVLQKYKHKIFA